MSTRHPAGRPRERGIVMAIALFALATLVIAVATSFFVGDSTILSTRNYRATTEVHFVGESAISQALQVVNGPGVVNFQNDVYNRWGATWGSGTRGFAAAAGYTYRVSPILDGGDPVNLGRFVATADGPEGAHNVVVAAVVRSDIPSTAPGAIYLATNDPTNSNFNGNSFGIDGNDRNYTGGNGPGGPVPGISTRTDANTQEAITSLDAAQKDDVTGLGFSAGPPVVSSVWTSPAAPSVDQVNQIVDDLLARPHTTITDGNVNDSTDLPGWCKGGGGDCTPTPAITYFDPGGPTSIKGNGNVAGSGIMIVEGDLTIQGTLDFKGLIIVRGRTRIAGDTEVTGHARLWGSLWTDDINLVVGGDAFVQYSTQALQLANLVAGGNALPAPLKVTSLADCALVPAGTNGCPG
jgi:hypothetical protein